MPNLRRSKRALAASLSSQSQRGRREKNLLRKYVTPWQSVKGRPNINAPCQRHILEWCVFYEGPIVYDIYVGRCAIIINNQSAAELFRSLVQIEEQPISMKQVTKPFWLVDHIIIAEKLIGWSMKDQPVTPGHQEKSFRKPFLCFTKNEIMHLFTFPLQNEMVSSLFFWKPVLEDEKKMNGQSKKAELLHMLPFDWTFMPIGPSWSTNQKRMHLS